MHESYRRLNGEERTLSRMIANMQVEEIDITRQIDRVEAARSELSKTRTLMVFRMYRVLNPAQRTALKEWMDPETGTTTDPGIPGTGAVRRPRRGTAPAREAARRGRVSPSSSVQWEEGGARRRKILAARRVYVHETAQAPERLCPLRPASPSGEP